MPEWATRRTGLDHVGFHVPSRTALNDWLDHFEALGVEHSPIADREYGAVLTFRDPDGIQFENVLPRRTPLMTSVNSPIQMDDKIC